MDYFDFDGFADLIADRVVAKMAAQNGQDWPGVETKEDLTTWSAGKDVKGENFDDAAVNKLVEQFEKQEEPVTTVQSYDEIDTRKAERVDALNNLGRDRVKELLKAAGEDLRAFGRLSDEDFFEKAASFEILTGKELDDASEDEITEPEAEDAEEPELTRESALELDLADLKEIGRDNGLSDEDMKGLDTPAVVDLLFGESEEAPAAEADEDDEEVELTEEQVRDASIAELKEWADQFGIEYTRSTSRNDLVELILGD